MPPTSTTPRAQPLGLRASFGFGDRLGLATAGHVGAARRFEIAPVFAQLSIRDGERLRRSAADAVSDTQAALGTAGFRGIWGADIAGVNTEGDVDRALAAGFSWFTLDPSGFIEPRADHVGTLELGKALTELVSEGILPGNWEKSFGGGEFELTADRLLRFQRQTLHRAAVKFARAMQHLQRLVRRFTQRAQPGTWEIEIALTGTTTPTTPLEHLFVALEARRRNLATIAIAPRFATPFEPGVDVRDAPAVFEEELGWHAAIARHYGPYKLSVRGVADKFSILPAIGRACGDLLHVKTNGLSYLEALRVVCRASPEFFRAIVKQARARFPEDREPAGVSTTADDLVPLFQSAGQISLENAFLGTPAGRQLLLATSMSILTSGETFQGQTLRETIVGMVRADGPQYRRLLDEVHTRHLAALRQG